MKSYKDIRKEMAGEPAADVFLAPCEACRAQTPVPTLNKLGAR